MFPLSAIVSKCLIIFKRINSGSIFNVSISDMLKRSFGNYYALCFPKKLSISFAKEQPRMYYILHGGRGEGRHGSPGGHSISKILT